MRRVLRWLWRLCWKTVLTTILLLGGGLLGPVMPTLAFADEPPHIQQTVSTPSSVEQTPQEREQARERAQRGRLIFLGSLLYQGVLLAGFFAMGGSRWLARIVARFGGRWMLAVAAVFGILTLAGSVLTLPLDYYSGFTFQHQYGLSNQTTAQWFRDYLVGQGVSLVTSLPLMVLAYAVLRRAPRRWWLWLTAVSIPVSILMLLIEPVFIAPLFNKFTPLQDAQLRQEILTMAHAQGIPAHDVFQVDASRQSNAINAYVVGFGPTHRIVLYDTLLKNFTHEEIKFVMAHEMGHYVLGHIRQGIILAIFGTLIGSFLMFRVSQWILSRFGGRLGYDALGNPASLPLLLVLSMVFSLIAMPISNAISRHIEWQADVYALKIDPHPAAGISSFRKMAKINVAEENPPRWAQVLFGTHPSLAKRIAMLEAAQRAEKR